MESQKVGRNEFFSAELLYACCKDTELLFSTAYVRIYQESMN